METAGIIAIALFMAGVIYGAGRLSARVDEHDRRLTSFDTAVSNIHAAIWRIEELVTKGAVG